MDKLADLTLKKHNLILECVPEFPGITTGGLYNGTCGESASFKYGLTDRSVDWVEMVTADGKVVKASPTENPDLYYGAAESLGTFGVTTLLQLRLTEAKKYVATEFIPVYSPEEAVSRLQDLIKDTSLDFVDGILFSESHGVLVAGRLTDEKPDSLPIRTFTNPWDPWFYMHAQAVSSQSTSPVTEYIPIYDYLFRYDRNAFWMGRSAFTYMLNFPCTRFTRWFLDDLLRTRFLYKALHASAYSDSFIVQDLAIPYDKSVEFIKYTSKTFGIWPLWLCPLRERPGPTERKEGESPNPHLNIGLWGFPPSKDSAKALNLDLERKLKELNGVKWLYAQQFYDEDSFWAQHDRPAYDALRKKYNATSLPSVYDKVKRGREKKLSFVQRILSMRPLAGFYGIIYGTLYGEYGRKVTRRGEWDSIELVDDAVSDEDKKTV